MSGHPAAASQPTQPTVPTCGIANLSAAEGPSPTSTSVPSPTTLVSGGGGPFDIVGSTIYVESTDVVSGWPPVGTTTIDAYSLSTGKPTASPYVEVDTPDPANDLPGNPFTVDPQGDVFVIGSPSTLEKVSPSGQVLWSWSAPAPINDIYPWHDRSGDFEVGIVQRDSTPTQDAPGSTVVDENGEVVTTQLPITGRFFTPTSSGGMVSTDGNYVYEWDSSGNLLAKFGDELAASRPATPTGGPFIFQAVSSAAEVNGRLFVSDPGAGLVELSLQGDYEATISDSALGGLQVGSSLMTDGQGNVYFVNGGGYGPHDSLVKLSSSQLSTLLSNPRVSGVYPVASPPTGPVLGLGAGVETSTDGMTAVPGNYFAPGSAPYVNAIFDPWWQSRATSVSLSYSVRSWSQVLDQTTVAPTTVPLSAAQPADDNQLVIPLSLPAAAPGTFEVSANLVSSSSGSVLGSTCLHYSVGAPGDNLNLSSLPGSADGGGPPPARGVALASDLGTGGFRTTIDWTSFLPDCNFSSPTTAACGPGALSFPSPSDDPFVAAATEAAGDGQRFWVQLGSAGDAGDLLESGLWQPDIQAVMSHYKSQVDTWECWNEPNTNTFSSGSDYVSRALEPCYYTAKAVSAANQVIGGSVIGDMSMYYWDQIAQAGGFFYMDIVGIHPYPGNNRSWDEDGFMQQFAGFRSLLASNGASSKPIWVTELGWWSDGAGNLYPQGDFEARALLTMRELGISVWNDYVTEGNFSVTGSIDYSVIDTTGQSDDYVKPAALTLMTASRQTAGRQFVGTLSTGVPHATAIEFGAAPGGSDQVVATWTDDLDTTADLDVSGTTPVPLTITDEMGGTTTQTVTPGTPLQLHLSGSPQYITAPDDVVLSISAPESFGSNLALQSAGATASASSSLSGTPASNVIQGNDNAQGGAGTTAIPVWASQDLSTDPNPTLTVTLPGSEKMDRVLISTESLGSISPGLRNYQVQLEESGNWVTVASQTDEFFQRIEMFSFAPQPASGIRVVVSATNLGGYLNGLAPWYWPVTSSDSLDYTFAVVYSVEAYAPGSGPNLGSTDDSYHPLAPKRLVDTRAGSGEPFAGKTLGPGQSIEVPVAGSDGVPPDASAAVLNVTEADSSRASYLTAWPTGQPRPLASNLNFAAGQVVPNLVEVSIGSGGKVSIYNDLGDTDVVVDLEGYVEPGSSGGGLFNPVTPARIADTRSGSGEPYAGSTLRPGSTLDVSVTGRASVPQTGVTAVVLNVTATDTTASSYLTAFPAGQSRPLASNLNFGRDQTTANRVIVPVGTGGQVGLFNDSGDVNITVDISGYFSNGGEGFTPTSPSRIADTRPASGEPYAGDAIGPGGSLRVQVAGVDGIPADATAVVANLTETDASSPSYIAVYGDGEARPLVSNINFVGGETSANLVVVQVGPDGAIDLYNAVGTVDVVIDVAGWYS